MGESHLQYSIAQRISWAAQRKRTRSEDVAYSLLGILDVNLPLLYGEGGAKAFLRLQEEVLKYSTDQSILAWDPPRNLPYLQSYVWGALAESPVYFSKSGDVIQHRDSSQTSNDRYTMSNIGLRISLPLLPSDRKNVFWASIACARTSGEQRDVQICLLKLGKGIYARVSETRCGMPLKAQREAIYLRQNGFPSPAENFYHAQALLVRGVRLTRSTLHEVDLAKRWQLPSIILLEKSHPIQHREESWACISLLSVVDWRAKFNQGEWNAIDRTFVHFWTKRKADEDILIIRMGQTRKKIASGELSSPIPDASLGMEKTYSVATDWRWYKFAAPPLAATSGTTGLVRINPIVRTRPQIMNNRIIIEVELKLVNNGRL